MLRLANVIGYLIENGVYLTEPDQDLREHTGILGPNVQAHLFEARRHLNEEGLPAHALFSASGASKWQSCYGSLAMEFGLPDEDTDDARVGRRAHDLLRSMLDYRLLTGEELESEWPDPQMWNLMRASAQRVWEWKRDGELHTEVRLRFGEYIGVPGEFGTGDCLIFVEIDGELWVIGYDLKYGANYKNKIFAKNNKQIWKYILGSRRMFPEQWKRVKRIRLIIDQPRLDHLDISDHTLDEMWQHAEQATRDAEIAMEIINRGVQFDDLHPGIEECKWCRAKPYCQAHSGFVGQIIFDNPDAMNLPVDEPQKVPAFSDDPRVIGHKFDMLGIVEGFSKALRQAAFRMALEGRFPVGKDGEYFFAAGKQGNRKFLDELAVVAFLELMGVPESKIYAPREVRSVAQLENQLGGNKELWAELADFIHRSPGGKTLVPGNSRRENVSAHGISADDFQEYAQPIDTSK